MTSTCGRTPLFALRSSLVASPDSTLTHAPCFARSPGGKEIDVSAGLLERIRSSWGLVLDEPFEPSEPSEPSASARTRHPPRSSSSSSSSPSWVYANLHDALLLTIEELENQGFRVWEIQRAARAVLCSFDASSGEA